MTRQSENNRVDKTLRKLSLDREAPKSAFILLVLLYAIATFLTVTTGRMHGETIIFGIPVEYASLPGIFSTLGNICIIMLVVLFFRRGIMGDRELPALFMSKKAKRREDAPHA